ncbi:MAG TPA: hypothetical protein VEI24_07925 [Nitrospiria bacterium]|nr:hypothetical protein [Nitrospiria bacterium]
MMRWAARRSVVAACLLTLLGCTSLHLTAPARGGAGTPAEEIDDLLTLSGLSKQIELIPSTIQSKFAQHQQNLPHTLRPQNSHRLLTILTEAYNPSDFRQSIVDYFAAHYNRDRVQAELRILRSPLNQKLMRLDEQASTPDALEEIKAIARKLESEPPAPERMALIRTFDRVSGSTDLGVDLYVSTSMTVISTFNAASPKGNRLTQAQLDDLSDQLRKEVRDPIDRLTTATLLYMFRATPDAEIRQCIVLYENDTAEWFNQIVKDALIGAMVTATEKASREISTLSSEQTT